MRDQQSRRSHRPHGQENAFDAVQRRVSPEQLIEIAQAMPMRRFIVWKRFYLDGWTIYAITQHLRAEGYRASPQTCARERLAADCWLLDKVENCQNGPTVGTFVERGGVLAFRTDETVMAVVRNLRGGFIEKTYAGA